MDLSLRRLRGLSAVETAVFAAGTSSMGLEILAGRIIAPSFGSSIYTWGSIIGVFLTALALGYHRGGQRAAERARSGRLVQFLLFAATYVGLVVLAGDVMLTVASGLPVPARLAPLVPVALLFGPPVYFLGFVSPYAAALSEREETGAAAGEVYALGTAGSIVGAFATTFLLVPELSVPVVGGVLAGVLLLAALRLTRGRLMGDAGRVLFVGLLLVGTVAGSTSLVAPPGTVYQTETAYQHLRVADSQGTRTLYLDGQRHSAMDKSDPTAHVYDYTRYFHLPLLMRENVSRVLFIGGGGFTGPKAFAARYDVTVDVVEIDPEVVRVAKEYFAVEESDDLRIHVADGRRFLRETNHTYDVIVLDAYKKDKVPFHMTTREFMALTAERMDEDGVLVANVISTPGGPGSKFFRAEYRTMSQVYPQVYAFPTAGPGVVQNIEIVATKDPERLTEAELRERNRERDIGVDLSREVGHYRADVPTGDVPVLRDEKAPVAPLLDPLLGQRYVVTTNGTEVAG